MREFALRALKPIKSACFAKHFTMVISSQSILIYCDGACSGNPGRGGWGAIVVLPEGKVQELGGEALHTTNNQMELTATIRALESVANIPCEVTLLTDSVYVIRGITQWIWGWRKKGWKTAEGKDVANRELWEELSRVVAARDKKNEIHWGFVRGHTGVAGNERVDEIAVAFSKGVYLSLYRGSLDQYSVPVHDIPEDISLPDQKTKQEPKAAALCYLSLVDGIAIRHSTWPECERRVKGRSGAKFKKAMTPAQETEILSLWGIPPSEVK